MIHLHNDDCLPAMREMEDNQFSLAIVDPPYFDGPQAKVYFGRSVSTTGIHRLKKNDKHWERVSGEYFMHLKRVAVEYIFWGCNYYPEFQFHTGRIVWDKVNPGSDFSDCEIASTNLFDHTRKVTFMWNGMLQGKSMTEGHLQQGNKKLNEKRIHPTQKPASLYKILLRDYASPGDTILDTHGGSGSLAIACHDYGFDLVMYEIDTDYYNAAVKRLDDHQKQMRLELE